MIKRPPGRPLRKGLQDYPEFMSDEAFSGWVPSPGKLRTVLQRAEYNMLGDAPIFEGNFVQVTKKGEYIGIHNHPHIITMGILASSPNMLLPDLMIIARERQGTVAKVPKSKDLEITRLIPLDLVEIFVQNVDERRLKVQMVTGRKYYLQLYAPGSDENILFEHWMRLIYLLHVVRGRIASFTSKESGLHTIWKRDSLQAMTGKHWLPAIMDKGSTERMKKHLQQVYSSRENHSSTESDLTSRQNLLKSDFAGYASQGPQRNVGTAQEHPFRQKTHYSTPKAKKKSHAAKPKSRVPQSKKQPKPKPMSARSIGTTTSAIPTTSVGVGHSQPLMIPAAVGPSRPASRTTPGAPGASQAKSVQQFIPLISPGSEHAPVQLQSRQKSTKEEYSEIQSKAAAVKSQERTPVQSNLHRPSSQGTKRSPSLSPSTKQSRPMSSPASIRASSTSPAPRTHISVAVGPSDLHSVPVAAGPSEAGAASTAAGPSRPASWGSHLASDRHMSSVAAPEQERQGRSSSPHSQMTGQKPREIIKSHSSRGKSWSPSQKRGSPISPSRSRKEQPKPVPVRRTAESVAVGPSQAGWKTVAAGPSLPGYSPASKPQSQPSGVGKESDTKSKPQKAKSKERSRPSSATEKQKKVRARESDTKNKLKSALSSARNKSSVSFITIYSALSSSLDKMKRSRSKDVDLKDDDKNVVRKPSKRVTISGVIGPSGKSVLQQEGEATKPQGSTGTEVDSDPAALKGMETEEPRPPELHLSKNYSTSAGKIPAVGGNISEAEPQKPENQIMTREPLMTNPEEARKTVEQPSILRLGNQDASQVTSRPHEKLGSHISPSKIGSKASQLKTLQKSLPNREVPRKAEGDSPPPRSKISVATGHSAVQAVSVAVGVSIQESISAKQTIIPSQHQSRLGANQRSGSKPPAVLGSPFKSRASVGVGRSAVETKSMGVGHSLVDRVSQGAGPSRPTSKMGQRSQGKSLSKSQQFGFGELEAKPTAKTMSSQKSKTPATSRPASSSHEPKGPSDRSGL